MTDQETQPQHSREKEIIAKWSNPIPYTSLTELSHSEKFGGMIEEMFGNNIQGKRFLDIGCGVPPKVSIYLASKGAEAYALDKKGEDKKNQIKSFYNVNFICDNTRYLKEIFKGEKFDGIISKAFLGLPFQLWMNEENRQEKPVTPNGFFKTCYNLTKEGGYNVHYKYYGEWIESGKKDLEKIGFEVITSFDDPRDLGNLGTLLVLRKPYSNQNQNKN